MKPKDDDWCTADVSIFKKVLANNAEEKLKSPQTQHHSHLKPSPTHNSITFSSPPTKKAKCTQQDAQWKMALHTPPEPKTTDSEPSNSFDEHENEMIHSSLKTQDVSKKLKPNKPKPKAKSSSSGPFHVPEHSASVFA